MRKPNHKIAILSVTDWQISTNQYSESEAKKFPTATGLVVGWLLEENDEKIVIASHQFLDEDGDEYRMVTAIPKSGILEKHIFDPCKIGGRK